MKGRRAVSEAIPLIMKIEPVPEKRANRWGQGFQFLTQFAKGAVDIGGADEVDKPGKLSGELRLCKSLLVMGWRSGIDGALKQCRVRHRSPRLPPLQSPDGNPELSRGLRLGASVMGAPFLQGLGNVSGTRPPEQLAQFFDRNRHATRYIR